MKPTAAAQVGSYRISRLINRGGQGSVYLGYDTLLKRQVAIKIYDLPARRAARKHLLTEAQLIASLDTPKIVPVYDVIESDLHLAMVMAYIPGCSLESLLGGARPSLESVISIITDIAGALAVARQSLVVHGDVKPSNVLLGTDGQARLTDFGIARDLRRPAPFGQLAGSHWSLAPEHLRDEEITQQVDIFALGVILYRMLTLQHPFAPDDGQINSQWLLEAAPIPLAGRVPPEFEVPPTLEPLIHRMLDKDPRQRPNNTRGIRQVLRDLSRDLPMTSGSAVLRESRPFFRPESPEDVPPDIPAELARSGRSRLKPPAHWWQRPWYWFTGLRKAWQVCLAAGTAITLVLGLGFWLSQRPTTVTFVPPELRVSPEAVLAKRISGTWLQAQLRTAVDERLTRMVEVDAEGLPLAVVYSKRARPSVPPPTNRFSLSLECGPSLCVVAIDRQSRDDIVSERTTLFADSALGEWERAIQSMVNKLLER